MDTVRIADLRARGVDAAMELVAELGEEGLTMRGLARRLGVSTTAMYQIYENKAAIVRALRFRGVAQLDDALAPAFGLDDPMERIREMSRRYVGFARSVPWLYRTLFQSEPLPPESLSEDETRRMETSLSALVTALREGVERGHLRADLDLDLLPYRLWARNHGLVMLILSGKLGPDHPVLAVEDIDAFVERFLAHTVGLLAADGRPHAESLSADAPRRPNTAPAAGCGVANSRSTPGTPSNSRLAPGDADRVSPPRGTGCQALSRDTVIKASLQLGQEVGEDGLTMRALATRLGVSATSLYAIFDGKEAIVRELRVGAWHALGDGLAPVLRLTDREERLRAMCRTYLEFAEANPWLYQLAMDAPFVDDLEGDESERALGPARVALAALREGAPSEADDAQLRMAVVELWASLHGLATLLASGQLGPANHPALADPKAFAARYVDDLVATL